MIKRVYDADFINSVINHPSVREGAEIKEIADVSEIAANLNNFILVNDFGGFIVLKKLPGVYECHTQFLPEGRGQFAVDAVNEALHYMFTRTDCIRIVTKVNVNNKPTRMFTGQFFRSRGSRDNYKYYSLDIEDWIERSADCAANGAMFHKAIEQSVDRDADTTHESYVGAALLMAQNGNLYKGQMIFNRWAMMPGYEPIIVLTENPIVLQLGPLKLAIDSNEVTLCPLH